MAWPDAGQRLDPMPTARIGGDFALSNRPALSISPSAAHWYWDQSFTASGMICDHVSLSSARSSDYATETNHGEHLRARRAAWLAACSVSCGALRGPFRRLTPALPPAQQFPPS